MPRKSYFKSSAGLKRSSTILNCRKVARNQGIGMCRNSKRSDQSVGEKEGGLASSMLKARSQDRQTSWFDPCDSCRAAVRLAPSRRPGVPSACSDAAVHRPWACIGMGIMAIQGNPSIPASDQALPPNIRERSTMHFLIISDGAGSGSWGESKTRKWYRLVLAELQPRASSRQQDFRDIGPSWSQTVSETRCGQVGSSRPSPAQPSARSRAVSGRLPRNQGAVAGQ